jgi:hypothetical protein
MWTLNLVYFSVRAARARRHSGIEQCPCEGDRRGMCPLFVATPFIATEIRRSRVLLGARNQERLETMNSLAGHPS